MLEKHTFDPGLKPLEIANKSLRPLPPHFLLNARDTRTIFFYLLHCLTHSPCKFAWKMCFEAGWALFGHSFGQKVPKCAKTLFTCISWTLRYCSRYLTSVSQHWACIMLSLLPLLSLFFLFFGGGHSQDFVSNVLRKTVRIVGLFLGCAVG